MRNVAHVQFEEGRESNHDLVQHKFQTAFEPTNQPCQHHLVEPFRLPSTVCSDHHRSTINQSHLSKRILCLVWVAHPSVEVIDESQVLEKLVNFLVRQHGLLHLIMHFQAELKAASDFK